MKRPTPNTVRRHNWNTPNGSLPGIALIGEHGTLVHLTPAEAITVATQIVDIIKKHPELRENGANHG